MRGNAPASRRLNYVLSIVIVLLIAYIFILQRAPGEIQVTEVAAPTIEPTTVSPEPVAVTGCQKLFFDSDGDSYGTEEIDEEVCAGEEIPLGYALRGGDCNDFNSSIWNAIELYEDHDKDGYGINNLLEVCTNNQAPIGTVSILLDPIDCDDRNALVHPKSARQETAGSPDYNCDNGRDLPVGSIFVTSQQYRGNLGGLSGADSKCAENALSSDGLPLVGTWKAILSTSEVAAVDRLPDTPLVDAFGTLIATSRSNFTQQFILTKIEYNEMGISTPTKVWTGTDASGGFPIGSEISTSTCQDWTSNNAHGIIGSTKTTTNSGWLKIDDSVCSETQALYCVRIS